MLHSVKAQNTHLSPDTSLGLERVEMWLKAGVNPFDRHKLITEAQAAQLEAIRQCAISMHTDSGRNQWASFEDLGKAELKKTPEAERRETIVGELNTLPGRAQPFTERIFLSPSEAREFYYKQHRQRVIEQRGQGAKQQPSRPHFARGRTITATGAKRAFYDSFTAFMHRHGLSNGDIGAACIGVKTHEPIDALQVSSALSQLARNGIVSGPFASIERDPEDFFTKLETRLSTRNGSSVLIPAEERETLYQALQAARAKSSAASR